MPQLRRIQDANGEWWSVPPPPYTIVIPVPDYAGAMVMVLGDGGPSILVEDRVLAEYVLTMRDPAEHCDPLPECVATQEEWEARMRKCKEDGWDAQQAIAVDFYARHVIGWES